MGKEQNYVHNTPNSLMSAEIISLNPQAGVLVMTMYWRPRPADPDPEQPGEKLSALSYLPIDARKRCPCGSGKRFGTCCRLLPYWRPVCPNPGMQGYSLVRPQAASFTNVDADEIYAFLQEDERLYCIEPGPEHSFWIYWGEIAFDAPYGTVCFGDFELQKDHTFVVTALSDTRMQVLLEMLHPLQLGTPHMQLDPFPRVEKPVQRNARAKRRRHS